MEIFKALILGTVQGFSEFLPISSSGHLVLAERLLGFEQPGVLFDVVLHAGTLLAVLIYFRKKLLKLTPRLLLLLFIGTIPAAVIGFLFQDQLEASFGNIKAVGIELMITGVLCYLVDKAKPRRENITPLDSLLIGLGQAIAIIPGISRSGTTIFTGVWRGINKAQAAEFSFLLSIPAIAGAIVLQVIKYRGNDIHLGAYTVGFLASLVFGLLSISLLLNLLAAKKFKIFAVYCLVLGLIVLLI